MLPGWVALAFALVWSVVVAVETRAYLRPETSREPRLGWIAAGLFWLGYSLERVAETAGPTLETALTTVSFALISVGVVVGYLALRKWNADRRRPPEGA